jgi:hypothetical protein
MSKLAGIVLVVVGVILDNYAFLYDVHWGPQGGVIVLDRVRYFLAAAGVIAIASGLLLLLHWARSVSGLGRPGPRHAGV